MLKLVVPFVFLLVVSVQANPLQSRSSLKDQHAIFELEEPCVRQGGLCQRIEDCDPANLVTAHALLCPKQLHLGAVCCYF
ncbi:uncharacterized protein LOC119190829 [Manduca sexta]|uniref:uncharacterized protein LOC119190829 n=1 Tax=Manduca sexta TaxID=7130 RepID=UPI00188F0080|nr:uncharacterized protein LOC119190829 [Manduca sexta]